MLSDLKYCYFYSYPLNDAAETVGEIGSTIGKSMGGTSGIMYYSFTLKLNYLCCLITVYFSQVLSSSFRYSILCKAACTQLKTSSHSAITSKQCKIFSKSGSIQLEFYYIYFSFVLPHFGWTVHPL